MSDLQPLLQPAVQGGDSVSDTTRVGDASCATMANASDATRDLVVCARSSTNPARTVIVTFVDQDVTDSAVRRTAAMVDEAWGTSPS